MLANTKLPVNAFGRHGATLAFVWSRVSRHKHPKYRTFTLLLAHFERPLSHYTYIFDQRRFKGFKH